MFKKIRTSLFFILFLSFCATYSYADKFGSTLSADYISQDTDQRLKNIPVQTPAVPKTPAIQQTTASMPAVLETQPIENPVFNPATSIPKTPSISGASQVISLPSATDLRKVEITVPEYEKKFQEMMQAKEEQAHKKKRTLFESIFEELMRYGMLITLLLVLVVIFYALRKEKAPPAPPASTKPQDIQPRKKTIWDDDF
jgi:hypothetical protein